MGDFNAKSPVWGKRREDSRGSHLINFCINNDIIIENSPDLPPTFDCSRGQSWIDLILSKNLNHDLALEVSDEISNSDHRLLQLTWEQEKIESTQKKGIKVNHSNWFDIKQTIFKIINNNSHLELHSLQQQIDTIQKEIFDKTSYTPNNNRKPNKRNTVWWTLELKIKRSKTRALRRLYKKESNDSIRNIKKEAFKKSQSEYKKLIIHTKTIKFKEFINKITTNNCFVGNWSDPIEGANCWFSPAGAVLGAWAGFSVCLGGVAVATPFISLRAGASNHLLNYPTQEPVEKEVNSQTTKKAVQSAIDVPAMNIAIKNVRNINNGGILIETDSGKGLGKTHKRVQSKRCSENILQYSKNGGQKTPYNMF
ncbi:hypothetical protein CDAR_617201 [Caerostris darwini]|uniref:Endonuclease/exonuclease/phosphatase domain-containing protein n=1 Tax=Caerostris darwini TaxID=1538125 RepID=A0AAV4NSG7_9ARAC|nr:hypothetical protein CDAR_617201 [Caerostris darwini]